VVPLEEASEAGFEEVQEGQLVEVSEAVVEASEGQGPSVKVQGHLEA